MLKFADFLIGPARFTALAWPVLEIFDFSLFFRLSWSAEAFFQLRIRLMCFKLKNFLMKNRY